MRKYIYILIVILTLISCENIMDVESNIGKELIVDVMSPTDSLELINFQNLDMNRVKMGASVTMYCFFKNTSKNDTVKIYSIETTNATGLFNYSFPQGLPFFLKPVEDTYTNQNIEIKFIASTFSPGKYYDTLLINQEKYPIPIEVEVFY